MKQTALLSILYLFIHCSIYAQNSLEGLLYQDHSPVRVEFEDGKITKVVRLNELPLKSNDVYIAPGLIDNQINGYIGVHFSREGLSVEKIHKISSEFWKAGITTYIPTITTYSHDVTLKHLSILNQAKNDRFSRGSIAGFHLEGPYISPEDGPRGAHPLKYVRKPDWNEFLQYYEAAGENILQITLAPEIDGAMEFISHCQEKGIKVGLGHHSASASQIKEAIDRGARIATHLGNGLANEIHRHNNPLWPQLADDRLLISIICDGIHLNLEQIRVFHKTKGSNKIIITSDVGLYGGMKPGYYLNFLGDTIQVTSEGAVLYPAQNVLHGSSLTIAKGVGHIMKVTGCDLASAIQMASTNNAQFYGLNDRGEITPGKRADLILFTIDNFDLNVKKTIVAGEVMYEAGK